MRKGFSLFEMVLVVAIFGLLVGIAVPNYMSMRAKVRNDMCINNLRQLKVAKDQWAIENNKSDSDTPVVADLDPYIRDGTAGLKCPLDTAGTFATSYDINNAGTNPACKILPANHTL